MLAYPKRSMQHLTTILKGHLISGKEVPHQRCVQVRDIFNMHWYIHLKSHFIAAKFTLFQGWNKIFVASIKKTLNMLVNTKC